jgi:hypothetical protein
MSNSNETAALYLSLNQKSKETIVSTTQNPANFGKAQQLIDDLSKWVTLKSFGPGNIAMRSALTEAACGLYLLASGLYRPAFTSLRLFVELSLGSVHFSVNRLELAEWTVGTKDIVWSALVDEDNGILSKRYARAFFPELAPEVDAMNSKIRVLYRELSEHVHGNRETLATLLEQITCSTEGNSFWFDHFFRVCEVVIFSLSLRFLKELEPDERANIVESTNSNIGHIQVIRDYLGQ